MKSVCDQSSPRLRRLRCERSSTSRNNFFRAMPPTDPFTSTSKRGKRRASHSPFAFDEFQRWWPNTRGQRLFHAAQFTFSGKNQPHERKSRNFFSLPNNNLREPNAKSVTRMVMASSPPDQELLAAAARGDQAAFSQLYQRYRNRVYGFAYRMLGAQAGGLFPNLDWRADHAP